MKCLCTGVCFLAGITNPLPHVFSSIYKDSNTLHLPTERFSPVRRFSDGAASIQAFKAHLEKMGNNSSIKQLQQVKEGAGGPRKSLCKGFLLSQPCCFKKQKVKSLWLTAEDAQRRLSSRGAVPAVYVCSSPAECPLNVCAVHLRAGNLGGFHPPLSGVPNHVLCPRVGCSACPRGSHQHRPTAVAALPHFLRQQRFGAVPGCPGKRGRSYRQSLECTVCYSLRSQRTA